MPNARSQKGFHQQSSRSIMRAPCQGNGDTSLKSTCQTAVCQQQVPIGTPVDKDEPTCGQQYMRVSPESRDTGQAHLDLSCTGAGAQPVFHIAQELLDEVFGRGRQLYLQSQRWSDLVLGTTANTVLDGHM